MSRLQITRAPNLPIAPVEYEARQVEQTNNALRLYFNELDNMTQNVLGNHGMRFLHAPYGNFYDTTTQVVSAANTPTLVTYNTTYISDGVRIGTPTSRVYVDFNGVYNFQFSAEMVKSSGGTTHGFIWFRINGVDIVDSATKVVLTGPNAEVVAAWNYVVSMNLGDYFELVFASADNTYAMEALPAQTVPYVQPSVPSIIMTVTFVSATAT